MTDLHVNPAPQLRGNDQLGSLDDSVFNRLLKERIILLGSEVTDQVANRICAQLLLLAAEDPDPGKVAQRHRRRRRDADMRETG